MAPPTSNENPGNFANRTKEEVQDIASKGGQSSHSGGFASMDPDKQVNMPHDKPYVRRNFVDIFLERYC